MVAAVARGPQPAGTLEPHLHRTRPATGGPSGVAGALRPLLYGAPDPAPE